MLPSETTFDCFQESTLRFDGGAMFGHVPKAVWGRLVPTDDFNRVQTACNGLLVRMPDRIIVVETGMGTKWDDREVELYSLKSRRFHDILAEHGVATTDVNLVLLTHLHIDHAGGLTQLGASGKVEPVFPNATVIVQQGEWAAANNPDPRSKPSYRTHDFLPVHDAGRFQFVQGARTIIPGIDLIVTGGHTQWHQIVRFTMPGKTIYYLGDIIPSTAHLKAHWVMGYDLFPMEVMNSRARLLPILAQPNVICVCGHDPYNPVIRVVQGSKPGTYDFIPASLS